MPEQTMFETEEHHPATERTFIMVKPNAVERGLVGEIMRRFEARGYRLIGLKYMWANKERLEAHYLDLKDKPFFPHFLDYMCSGPVVPMVWEGVNAVKTGRAMLGACMCDGTIRGDFNVTLDGKASRCHDIICHGSDAVEEANREINIWFSERELCERCGNKQSEKH